MGTFLNNAKNTWLDNAQRSYNVAKQAGKDLVSWATPPARSSIPEKTISHLYEPGGYKQAVNNVVSLATNRPELMRKFSTNINANGGTVALDLAKNIGSLPGKIVRAGAPAVMRAMQTGFASPNGQVASTQMTPSTVRSTPSPTATPSPTRMPTPTPEQLKKLDRIIGKVTSSPSPTQAQTPVAIPQRYIKDANGVWKLTSDPNEVNTADTSTPTPQPHKTAPLNIRGIRSDFQKVRTDIQDIIAKKFSDVPHEAVNMSAAESSINPNLVHVNGSNEAFTVNSPEELRKVINEARANGTSVDIGLFQINDKWQEKNLKKWGYTLEDMLDPEKNIDVARRIYEANGNRWGTTWAANSKYGYK